MKTGLRQLVTAAALVLVSGSATMVRADEIEGEKEAIRKVIEASIGWADNKDTTKLFNSVAQDEDFFYFSPDNASTVSGFKMFQEFTRNTFMGDNFKALWWKTKEMAIGISRSGDAAWWHCLLDDVGLWDGQEAGWHDCRWTGVLEKRDGKWVIVQMHFSLATDRDKPSRSEDSVSQSNQK